MQIDDDDWQEVGKGGKKELFPTGGDKTQAKITYQQKAIELAKYLHENQLRNDLKLNIEEDKSEKTACIMFYLNGNNLEYDISYSAFPLNMKTRLNDLRAKKYIQNKRTVCAEEHLLAVPYAGAEYLFSAAFDAEGGKKACSNCRLLLEYFNIEDLHN